MRAPQKILDDAVGLDFAVNVGWDYKPEIIAAIIIAQAIDRVLDHLKAPRHPGSVS